AYNKVEEFNEKGRDNLDDKDWKDLASYLRLIEISGMPYGAPEVTVFPDSVSETVNNVVSEVEEKFDSFKSELKKEDSETLFVLEKAADRYQIGISNMRESLMDIFDNPDTKKGLIAAVELGLGTYLISEISKNSSNSSLLAAELMAGFAATWFYLNNPDKRSPLIERAGAEVQRLGLDKFVENTDDFDNLNYFSIGGAVAAVARPINAVLDYPGGIVPQGIKRIFHEVDNTTEPPWTKMNNEDTFTPINERSLIDENGNITYPVDNSKKYYEYSIGNHYFFALDEDDLIEPTKPTVPTNISDPIVKSKYDNDLARHQIWKRELKLLGDSIYVIPESIIVLKNEKNPVKNAPYENRWQAVGARDIKRKAAAKVLKSLNNEILFAGSKIGKTPDTQWAGYKDRLLIKIDRITPLLSADGPESLAKDAERVGTTITDIDKRTEFRKARAVGVADLLMYGNLPRAIALGTAAYYAAHWYDKNHYSSVYKERNDSLSQKIVNFETKGAVARTVGTFITTVLAGYFIIWVGPHNEGDFIKTNTLNSLGTGIFQNRQANPDVVNYLGHTPVSLWGAWDVYNKRNESNPPVAGVADMPPADVSSFKNVFADTKGNTLLSDAQINSLGKTLKSSELLKNISDEKVANDKLTIEKNAAPMFTIIANEAKLPVQFKPIEVETLIKKFSDPTANISTAREKQIMTAIVNNSKNFLQYLHTLSSKEIITFKSHIESMEGQLKGSGQVEVLNGIDKIMEGQGITEDEAKNIFQKLYTK
ncbi:hypothetical protein, partial [Flavobacterium sp.]|uniref:hypothetical protein n=1 Tax=Flavobacterium sp. TaxID=239 RepID=UPI0032651B72